MLIAISQSPKYHVQIATFVQPTVQNPKTLHAIINDKENREYYIFFY